jgi:hypothetical protein
MMHLPWHRSAWWAGGAVVACVVSTDLPAQETLPVLIKGPPARVAYAVHVDGEFAGTVGDAVRLRTGRNLVSIEGPHGAWLDMKLVIGVGWISNDGVSVRQPPCNDTEDFVSDWPWSYEPRADRTIVHLQAPVIGRRAVRPCPRARLEMLRPIGAVKLGVRSTPEKATVYIDGAQRGTTPRSLGVPYNERTRTISVVVSLNGHVGCRFEMRPPFPAEHELDCRLEPF